MILAQSRAHLPSSSVCAQAEEEIAALMEELPDDAGGDSREERAFRMWLNSLGCIRSSTFYSTPSVRRVSPPRCSRMDAYVNNLFDDMRDGSVLLQTMEHVRRGVVDWSRVNTQASPIRPGTHPS